MIRNRLWGYLHARWTWWRLNRARKRAIGHRKERKRLEKKYGHQSEMAPTAFEYELLRAAVVGLKLKVKP